jgi:hypothetical protein
MADHFLTQLVAAVKTKLTTPAPLASIGSADKFFTEDDFPKEKSLGKWVNIYAAGFERQRRGNAPNGIEVMNLVNVRVQCVAAAKGSAREVVAEIAKEVEARWLENAASERLVGIMAKPIHGAQCVGIEVRVDTDTDAAYAVAEMEFQAKVLTVEGRPDLT